ncbi:MAG: CO dehydrogenase/CO-methylating acetyl-CoA synthase complex subunit beta, partial [Methanoregulaceae archaeon]|nr:CO dehydrogenase/CO-methylating acetyl-CoA synthase complex subunit beta [Methanoregulaceae archaeon]
MIRVEEAIAKGKKGLTDTIQLVSGEFSYEETAYHLPVTYALTGIAVHSGDTARQAFSLTGENPLVAMECAISSSTTIAGKEPLPYTGFISDADLRKLGYSLVDGSILGLALVCGTPDNPDIAAGTCRELQEKLMLTFLAGNVVKSLSNVGVKVGGEYRLIPLGSTPSRAIHFLDVIARVAMMFGGVTPGDADRLLRYAKERARAMVILFPGLSDEEVALIDAFQLLGIPILTLGGYEGGSFLPVSPEEAVRRGMEMKGIKVSVTAIPIPMGCSPAFEGKSIRKEEMYVEFGGGRSPAFELLRARPANEVKDGFVQVIGSEIEEMKEGKAYPLAILVEVTGKAMKKEYEPVLERRIH